MNFDNLSAARFRRPTVDLQTAAVMSAEAAIASSATDQL